MHVSRVIGGKFSQVFFFLIYSNYLSFSSPLEGNIKMREYLIVVHFQLFLIFSVCIFSTAVSDFWVLRPRPNRGSMSEPHWELLSPRSPLLHVPRAIAEFWLYRCLEQKLYRISFTLPVRKLW